MAVDHWSVRKRKKRDLTSVADPQMGYLRSRGVYTKPAEFEKDQFLEIFDPKGPNRYLDDEIAMALFGAADAITLKLVDNVADGLQKIVNLGSKITSGQSLTKDEKKSWGDAIRDWRDKFGHEFKDSYEFGQFVGNFAPLMAGAKYDGLFGLAAGLFHKYGLKKGTALLARFGDDVALSARKGMDLSPEKTKNIFQIMASKIDKAADIAPGSSVFQGLRTGAEVAVENVATADEMAKWDAGATALSALIGGSLHKLAMSGRKATDIIPEGEKALRKRAKDVGKKIGLTEGSIQRLDELNKTRNFINANIRQRPKQAARGLVRLLNDMYTNKFLYRDAAIDALKSDKYNIDVSKISIPIKGQIKSIVTQSLPQEDRFMFLLLLDNDFDIDKSLKSFQNIGNKKLKGTAKKRFRLLMSDKRALQKMPGETKETVKEAFENRASRIISQYKAFQDESLKPATANVLKELERYRDTLHKGQLFQKRIKNPNYNPNGSGSQLDKEIRVTSEFNLKNIIDGLNQKADFDQALGEATNAEMLARFGQASRDINEYLKKKNKVFADNIGKSAELAKVLEGTGRTKTPGIFDYFPIVPLGRARRETPGFTPIMEETPRLPLDSTANVKVKEGKEDEVVDLIRNAVLRGEGSEQGAKLLNRAIEVHKKTTPQETVTAGIYNRFLNSFYGLALQDKDAAQDLVRDLQKQTVNLTKNILKDSDLPKQDFQAFLPSRMELLSFGGLGGGGSYAAGSPELGIGVFALYSYRKIRENQLKKKAASFYKQGEPYDLFKDVALLEDQVQDLKKAYATGNWSQVNQALETAGVGKGLAKKMVRSAARLRDWTKKRKATYGREGFEYKPIETSLVGDVARKGLKTLGEPQRFVAPTERQFGEDAPAKKEATLFPDIPVEELQDKAPEPTNVVPQQLKTEESFFPDAPMDQLENTGQERIPQGLDLEFPEPPPSEAIDPEEFPSPEPARGIFEPEEIQSPEAKDRELRSSRINSFLKQQGAYKRSRRRRQAIG